MELRDYQKEDLKFLLEHKIAGVFNQQRTGKTPTTISAVKDYKTLIVCPASLIYPWKEEWSAWAEKPCSIVVGTRQQKEKAIKDWESALVISYDSLKETLKSEGFINLILEQKPQAVILDEAHRIKNHKSQNYKAAMKLSKIPIKYALTGTPAPGKPEDIFGILSFLYPDEFRSYWRFVDNYFEQYEQFGNNRRFRVIGDFKPQKKLELLNYLNTCCTMRKRSEVMRWLPSKDYLRINLEPTQQQLKYLRELQEYYETENVIAQGTLDRLIRYRQICLDPNIIELKGSSPKTDYIIQYIKDYINIPIIIFSKSTKYIKHLSKALCDKGIDIGVITGETSLKTRKSYVKDFQDGVFNVLLINIDAGKEGLTLDRAETIIFTDKYPPIGDIEQAEDRFVATSIDKKDKSHLIIELCLKGTYDEQIYEMLKQRKTVTDVINNFKNYIKKGA